MRKPHPRQLEFIASSAKRKVIRAGRRGGKTVGIATLAVKALTRGRRVLYATPTQEQVTTFWYEAKRALGPAIDAGLYEKNESVHTITDPRSRARIRAKTAWNADTLRGDFADLLIFDEYQLIAEDAWELVGAPMLLDNDGDAVFIYTPPSLRTSKRTKARNPRHAAELYKRAESDTSGRWQAFHFTSLENPHISRDALAEIQQDMTGLSYQQEILAEDRDDAPGALWTRETLDRYRTRVAPETLNLVVVGVDPSCTATGDECGIVTAGYAPNGDYYVLDDSSAQASPMEWAKAAVRAYSAHQANLIVYESNQGGEMVAQTLRTVDQNAALYKVTASRGKQARAEPIAALYERGSVHHAGHYHALEDELCMWEPGSGESPNRLDALVWALTVCRDRQNVGTVRVY